MPPGWVREDCPGHNPHIESQTHFQESMETERDAAEWEAVTVLQDGGTCSNEKHHRVWRVIETTVSAYLE